jgi:Skp family chaperone for outer membrane proteins
MLSLSRTLIVTALVSLPALSGAAVANDARMSNTEFVRAARCLAHANLTILQDDRPNLDALTARVNHELTVKSDEAKSRARSESRRVYMNAAQADTPKEIAKMRADRDRLCSGFLQTAAADQPAGQS